MTGNMKRNGRVIIFSVLIIIIINAFCMLLSLKKNQILLAGDVFMCVGFGMLIVAYYLSKAKKDARSRFWGWPILTTGVKFFAYVSIFNTIIIIVNQFIDIPFFVVLFCNIVLFCVEGIALISVDSAREFVTGQDERRKQRMQTMKMLQAKLNTLYAQYNSGEIGKKLKKLQDKFRYSDPNSSAASVETEIKIQEALDKLENELKEDQEMAVSVIDEIEKLLKVRNQQALLK